MGFKIQDWEYDVPYNTELAFSSQRKFPRWTTLDGQDAQPSAREFPAFEQVLSKNVPFDTRDSPLAIYTCIYWIPRFSYVHYGIGCFGSFGSIGSIGGVLVWDTEYFGRWTSGNIQGLFLPNTSSEMIEDAEGVSTPSAPSSVRWTV